MRSPALLTLEFDCNKRIHQRFKVAALFLRAALLVTAVRLTATAETHRWNIQTQHGVTGEGVQQAVSTAEEHFATAPNDVVILEIDEGSFWLEDRGLAKGPIDLSKIKPEPNGRLIFQGKGMDKASWCSLTTSMRCTGVMSTASPSQTCT